MPSSLLPKPSSLRGLVPSTADSYTGIFDAPFPLLQSLRSSETLFFSSSRKPTDCLLPASSALHLTSNSHHLLFPGPASDLQAPPNRHIPALTSLDVANSGKSSSFKEFSPSSIFLKCYVIFIGLLWILGIFSACFCLDCLFSWLPSVKCEAQLRGLVYSERGTGGAPWWFQEQAVGARWVPCVE